MKETRFALFSTYNKIKFDDGSERISLSAPFIVSTDGMLSKTFSECRKLKLPFRLVGFFNPLILNDKDKLCIEVMRNPGKDQDGKPFNISSAGVSFPYFVTACLSALISVALNFCIKALTNGKNNKTIKEIVTMILRTSHEVFRLCFPLPVVRLKKLSNGRIIKTVLANS